MLDFAQIKAALAPSDERLLSVLENPDAAGPDGAPAVLSMTGWALDSLQELLQRFYGDKQLGHLSNIENLRRVYDAYAVLSTCRVSAKSLIAATINDPNADNVGTLQSALRALYAEADWLNVVKPINDTMRGLQRDALVAYILQRLGDSAGDLADINTLDKLFEFFLTLSSVAFAIWNRKNHQRISLRANGHGLNGTASGRRTARSSCGPRTGSTQSCETTSRRFSNR